MVTRGCGEHLAAVELGQAGQDAQQRRLARAVAADQAYPVAAPAWRRGRQTAPAGRSAAGRSSRRGPVVPWAIWGVGRRGAAGHARCPPVSTAGQPNMHQDLIETFERLGVRDVEVTDDVDKALARITAIYEGAVQRLRIGLGRFHDDGTTPGAADAFYPFVGVKLAASALNLDGGSPTAPCTTPASTGRRSPILTCSRTIIAPSWRCWSATMGSRWRPGSATGRSRCRSWSRRSAAA